MLSSSSSLLARPTLTHTHKPAAHTLGTQTENPFSRRDISELRGGRGQRGCVFGGLPSCMYALLHITRILAHTCRRVSDVLPISLLFRMVLPVDGAQHGRRI